MSTMTRDSEAMNDTRSEDLRLAGLARHHEIRLERLRRIRRLALAHGDEALADLLDLMIEEELGE